MKKLHLLFVLLVSFYLSGCNQMNLFSQSKNKKIVKKEHVKIIDPGWRYSHPNNLTIYKSAVYVLKQQDKLRSDNPKIIFNFKNGTAEIIFYGMYNAELQKKADSLIEEVKQEIKKEKQRVNIIRKNLHKIIYVENNALTPEQKNIFLNKFLNKYRNNIRIYLHNNRYCITWSRVDFVLGSLGFDVKRSSINCGYSDYKPFNEIMNSREYLNLSVYFVPNYKFIFNKLKTSVNSKMVKEYKGYYYYYYLESKVSFKNKTGNYQKIGPITLYYTRKATTFVGDLQIPPFSSTTTRWYIFSGITEINRKNKNNLQYGIAFEDNGETYSRIKSTTLDRLFEKIK